MGFCARLSGRLPVMLASAEAYDSSDPCEGCLPHSFSTIVCFSLEAIDITAALARCAMSRTDAPGVFEASLVSVGRVSTDLVSAGLVSAGLVSACFGAGAGGGTFNATWTGAD